MIVEADQRTIFHQSPHDVVVRQGVRTVFEPDAQVVALDHRSNLLVGVAVAVEAVEAVIEIEAPEIFVAIERHLHDTVAAQQDLSAVGAEVAELAAVVAAETDPGAEPEVALAILNIRSHVRVVHHIARLIFRTLQDRLADGRDSRGQQ